MEAARAARGRQRVKNRSLRPTTPLRLRRSSTDRAFERLYKEHVGSVYQYALAVLTNPADAEDVTQQTFLNAYRAFQRGERPHTPHNWLIKIAHNVCRMRWRRPRDDRRRSRSSTCPSRSLPTGTRPQSQMSFAH
jgi:RNA polymerase sigma-70 factor (ECF subfamily)